MGAQSVTGALDLDDDGVVQEAIQQCGGDDGVAEDLSPFSKAAIGCEDHRTLFVARVDELEEEVGATRGDGKGRSTLPLVLARYGRQARGRAP